MGEYVLQTLAVDACKEPGTVDQPILLAQKSPVGQNTFYTIFICKTAKATIFKPYLTIYTYMQSYPDMLSGTMWRERTNTFNIGPSYSIANSLMIDSMFLAVVLAIAQDSQSVPMSVPIYNSKAPGAVNLWNACFQFGTQHWNSPVKPSLCTRAAAVI